MTWWKCRLHEREVHFSIGAFILSSSSSLMPDHMPSTPSQVSTSNQLQHSLGNIGSKKMIWEVWWWWIDWVLNDGRERLYFKIWQLQSGIMKKNKFQDIYSCSIWTAFLIWHSHMKNLIPKEAKCVAFFKMTCHNPKLWELKCQKKNFHFHLICISWWLLWILIDSMSNQDAPHLLLWLFHCKFMAFPTQITKHQDLTVR
jgi:hypothetical protein